MTSFSNSTSAPGYTNEDRHWFYVSLNVTSSVTFIIGFPTNLIIILLVSRRRNLKNPTNYFVSSLAVADILVLVYMMIWIVGTHGFELPQMIYQHIYPSLDMFMGISSMINVASVSSDRAIAVAYPLSYEKIITRKRSVFVITACWIYSFFILITALMRVNIDEKIYSKLIIYAGFVSYFIPATIIIVCYTIIFLVIVHKLKGIRELEKVIANARHTYNNQSSSGKLRKLRRRKLLRELKVTGNVLVIVVPFSVGWSFFIGTQLYEVTKNVQIMSVAHNFSIIIIPWILSGLNPILYLLLNRSLRHAFLDAVRKCFKSNNYSFDDSRTSFLITLSRRASNAFRRTSTSIDDGNGFLSIPKIFNRRRDSKLSNPRQSISSSDATVSRETEVRLSHSSDEYGFAQSSLL